MAGGSEEGRKGAGSADKGRRRQGGRTGNASGGRGTLGEGSIDCPDRVSGGGAGGGIHMAGVGPHPEREGGLPGHRPSGGDVEGRGSDFKSSPHLLHHLPRRTPWFPGRLRHGDRHPRGQAAPADCSHKGVGPLRDLPGTV